MSTPRKKDRTPKTLRKSDSMSLRLVASESGSQQDNKSAEKPDSFIGKQIGTSFHIEKLLGMGGMGAVYLARDEVLNRDVAVKILRRDIVESPAGVLRFQREGEALARLDHEHIVKVYEFGLYGKIDPYIVMEYVPGRSLSQILKTNETLSIPRAIEIGMQLCSALDAAHTRRIVHRDLSPANVMVVEHTFGKETVKIVDFGIARIASDSQIKLTNADEIVGSPMYMSPEQCAGSNVDHRSDVYSLGCILYECLTGTPPFTAESSLAIMMKQQQEEPMTLAQAAINRDFPKELESIVAKLLEKNPDRRYQYADEVRHRLEAFCQTEVYEAVRKGWAKDLWPQESIPASGPRPFPPPPKILAAGSNTELRNEREKLRLELDHLLGSRSAIWWSGALCLLGLVLFVCCTFQLLKIDKDLHDEVSRANIPTDTRHAVVPHGTRTEEVLQSENGIPDSSFLEFNTSKDLVLMDLSRSDITDRGLRCLHNPLRQIRLRHCWNFEGAGLNNLSGISTLRSLDLTSTRVSNESMAHLNKNLHTLQLNCTEISDEGITEVAKLKNLRHLELRNLSITEKSLKALSKLNLDFLDLTDCPNITVTQISGFEDSHPNCVIKTHRVQHEDD